jgi:hypothetical protein
MTQLTLRDAVAGAVLKERGHEALEDHDASFVTRMRHAAIKISDESGFVSSDNLRSIAEGMGLVPQSPNSWGGIFRGPHWKVIGRQKSTRPGNHAREIRIWKYER